ncbi:hypothetical protein THAOC_21227, partial [Thalassiosira oceanica]
GDLETHWDAVVAVVAKWRGNSAELLGLLVEFKGVELHRDVKLAEELVAAALLEDLVDLWQVVLDGLDHL